MKKIFWFGPAMILELILSFNIAWGQECTITTVAGNGGTLAPDIELSGAQATEVGIGTPYSIAVDNFGSPFFSVQGYRARVLKILPDGTLNIASLPIIRETRAYIENDVPITDLKFDNEGNLLAVYNSAGQISQIYKLSPSGVSTSVLDGEALGYNIRFIAIGTNQEIYFENRTGGNRILKMSPGGIISTVAGIDTSGYEGNGGLATSATLNIGSLTTDLLGNIYLVNPASYTNNVVRTISQDGIIRTIAGDAEAVEVGDGRPATAAFISNGQRGADSGANVGIDNRGNIYIVDYGNNRIRKVSPDGVINTIAGNGTAGFSGDNGPAIEAQLNRPNHIAVGLNGSLFISDPYNKRIRKVTCPHGADLSVTASSTLFLRARRLNFTATVTNNGPETAEGVVVTHTLPSGYRVLDVWPTSDCTGVGSNEVVCDVGAVEVRQIKRLSLSIMAPQVKRGGSVTVIDNMMVSSSTDDPNPANNSAVGTRRVP